jgi:hypothetical protein
MDGWIKIHRKLLDWEWYDDGNVVRVFLHLLLTANFEPKNWHGITIERGQVATSVLNLANQVHLSPKQVRTALEKLKNTNEIDTQTANKYTLITICKYDNYQSLESDEGQTNGNQRANEGQTNGNQRATTKEIKNDNKEKNDNNILGEKTKRFIPPTIDEIKFYCQERKNNVDAERFFNFYEMKGWMIGKNKMKDWKAAVRTWEGNTYSPRNRDTSERDNRNLDGIW